MPQKNVFGKPEGFEEVQEVLLHACCAPCSSAIVEWLMANGVRPTIFYYNPNIWPREEYEIRKQESQRHAESLGIGWIEGDYDHDEWLKWVSSQEAYDVAAEPERGRRCALCFPFPAISASRYLWDFITAERNTIIIASIKSEVFSRRSCHCLQPCSSTERMTRV